MSLAWKINRRKLVRKWIPHATKCPIAQIAWLPKRKSSITLDKSGFYKHYFSCPADPKMPKDSPTNPEQTHRLEIHRVLTETFPFYLPARYHSMDASEMYEDAASPGSYWTNAIHFVRSCGDFGTTPFYKFNIPEDTPPAKVHGSPKENGNSKNKYQDFKFEGGPEQSESAAEFLLEPWVLIQLPFQPAMLHQWAVAALSETLKFAKKLVEIGTKGYATQFTDLFSRLTQLCETLSENCHTFLSNFFSIYCTNPEESLSARINKFLPGYPEMLSETLAALEFVQGKDCTSILEYIQSQSWRCVSPDCLQYSKQLAPLLCGRYLNTLNVYNEAYWLAHKVGPLCTPRIELTDMKEEAKVAECPEIAAKEPKVFKMTPAYLKWVKTFATSVLKARSIKSMKDIDNFAINLQHHMGPENFKLFKAEQEFLRSLNGRDQYAPAVEKGGALINILSLQAEVYAEGATGNITTFFLRAIEAFNEEIFTVADEAIARSKLQSIEDLDGKIDAAMAKKDLWTPRAILEKARNACASGAIESLPDVSSSTESFQEHFTRRIRLMVLRAYKEQYATLECGPLFFHPEAHVMQYILPCFVAMISDVDKDPKVNSKAKEEYKFFVNALIHNYERHVMVQVLEEKRKRHFHGRADFDKDLKRHLGDVVLTLESVFKQSASIGNIVSKIKLLGIEFRDVATDQPKQTPVDSKIQSSRLCYRLMHLIRMLRWPKTTDEFRVVDYVQVFKGLKGQASEVDKILTYMQNKNPAKGPLDLRNVSIQKSALLDSSQLTLPQLVAVAIHLTYVNKMDRSRFFSIYQGPLFFLDPLEALAHNFLDEIWMEIKVFFAPFFRGPQHEDRSLIPIKVALQNVCCQPLLNSLTAQKDKLQLDWHRQVLFNPIQHCRKCGLVNAQSYRLCLECQDEPKYPHFNYFCSEECETVALNEGHNEEHAFFVMVKLGIEK